MRSAGVPTDKTLAFFLLIALRIRELRTGASVLGLTPTKRMTSASSII